MPRTVNDNKPPLAGETAEGTDDTWPIVYAYTRAQALRDGFLVDVSDMAREAGLLHPCAITRALFETLTPDRAARAHGQSFAGRLWDVLTLARIAAKRAKGDSAYWSVWIDRGDGHRRRQAVWMRVTGEGHNGAPVLTIMLEGED